MEIKIFMLTQEKATEYQQVAALVCMDLDMLKILSERSDMTLEELKEHISIIVENKEQLINDSKIRQSRYQAASLVFGLACS